MVGMPRKHVALAVSLGDVSFLPKTFVVRALFCQLVYAT